MSRINSRAVMVFKWMLLLAILGLFAGCKTKTVLIPVEKIKIEYRDRLRVDSVYNSDTTYIRISDDTILVDIIRWRNRYILKTDSVVRVDSIPYPVEVVTEENKLTKWQRWRLNALNIIAIIIVAYVIIKIRFS